VWVSSNFADPFVPVNSSKPSVTGSIAPDWKDGSENYDVDIAYSSTGGHGGGVAQRMNVTAVRTGQAQVYHSLDFVAGWRYEVFAWMKGSGNATLAFQQATQPYAYFGDTAVALNGDWQRVRLTGLITSSSAGNLVVGASAKADISFDDFEVRAVKASPTSLAGTQITSDTFGIHEGRIASMALRNPGFEGTGRIAGSGVALETGAVISGSVATGWSENSFWANVSVNYAMDTSVVHGGTSSQRIEVAAIRKDFVQYGQQLLVRTPSRLRFTQWVKGPIGNTGGLQIRKGGIPYNGIVTTSITFNGSWQLITVEGNIAEADTDVFVNTFFDQPGTYWIDDANLLNVTSNSAPDWIPAPSSGGTMRLWDTSTTWSDLEPQRGVWDFSVLDRFVKLAQSRNQNVLLTLGQTPAWASSNISELSYNGLGSVYGPKSLDDWRNMVRVLSTRYKGRIAAYEIWNEPNDPNFAKLSMNELIDLTRVASQEIRSNDPAAKVVSASPYSIGYLDSYLAAGVANYVDVIAYHHYTNFPELMIGELSSVRYTLDDYGVTKPIWLTEGGSGDEKQSESVVADALLRWNLVAMASGMQRAFWYTWGPGFNISGTTIRGGSWEPNAAFAALTDMQKRLTGRLLTKVTTDATTGRWAMEFTNAAGNVLTASWARGGSAPPQPVIWS
jgi:hypothetical protein